MNVPAKDLWLVTASSGEPRAAIDDVYATTWQAESEPRPWLQIDLGTVATLGGAEIYWGRSAPVRYALEASLDGQTWSLLCRTGHGEGGQDVFAFPPTEARFVRWCADEAGGGQGCEIVEINLYSPAAAASVRESGRVLALGRGTVDLPPGESITVDLGYPRSPLGVLVQWGERYGTVFSVGLSDDGEQFREVGRIVTGDGDADSFYWRTTRARYLRFTVHEASAAAGAVVEELKLRILNKDRMPIGQLERAALAGNGELYPQALSGRQVYWTALGEAGRGGQALFDEFGNIEPQPGSGQLMPLLRLPGGLRGAPGADRIEQSLAGGSLPIPTVRWSFGALELAATALCHLGQVLVEYRLTNSGPMQLAGALVLALRPVQINPYWQHGGHALIRSLAVEDRRISVDDRPYAAFSVPPDALAVADFTDGDVIERIARGRVVTPSRLQSASALLSAACEFDYTLAAGESWSVVAALPLRDGVEPNAALPFDATLAAVIAAWREILGPRRITVGDAEVSDTVEAQFGLILVNATEFAFKPGPRNYDRTWIRDGSSQALALLYAGRIEDAKRYVRWYAERIYDNGMVPPILNPDGSINRGYGSDIEFDAQGQFVAIAADTYRISRDREFLEAIFEPVVRATRFIEELCARTNAQHGPESRFHGLLAPSISHEGYNKPTYSYWDDYFALRAWRDCAYLAEAVGAAEIAAHARSQGAIFAEHLRRSLRLSAEAMGSGLVPASADRLDVDPTSLAIAFEPCRVTDVLPEDLLPATYDLYLSHLDLIAAPDFKGGFSPYEIRNINALIGLGRSAEAFRLLRDALSWRRPAGWRHWAEVVWGELRAPDYIGDMPHTWIGAEFATAVRRMLLREEGETLELLRAVPDAWWQGEGIVLKDLPTGFGRVDLRARREDGRIEVELGLTGPMPERVHIRCPGAKAASADGQPCRIDGAVIAALPFSHLEIRF